MIFVYAFITIVILTTVAAITIFLHPTRLIKQVVAIGILLCIIIGAIYGMGTAVCHADITKAKAEYDDLMLYYYTVEMSNNEYLRYDYYNKVNVFNDKYNRLLEISESKWFGCFCDQTALAEFSIINFTLHGDDYGEG